MGQKKNLSNSFQKKNSTKLKSDTHFHDNELRSPIGPNIRIRKLKKEEENFPVL